MLHILCVRAVCISAVECVARYMHEDIFCSNSFFEDTPSFCASYRLGAETLESLLLDLVVNKRAMGSDGRSLSATGAATSSTGWSSLSWDSEVSNNIE